MSAATARRPAAASDALTSGTGRGREPFNACAYLLDRHVASGAGARPALCCAGRLLSYEALLEEVSALSWGLEERGLRAEERVLLVLPDGVDFVVSFLAALRLGAIPVPVNPRLPASELVGLARETRVRVVLAGRDDLAAPLAGLTRPPGLYIADRRRSRPDALSGLCAQGRRRDPEPTWADSPGPWLCTSGSTGQPKLAMHRHADLRIVAEGYAREVLGVGPGDRTFSAAPLFHAYGLGNGLVFPLAAGAMSILEPRRPLSTGDIADVVEGGRVTLFFAVPTTYAALLQAGVRYSAFASVRRAVSAGEALPPELFGRAKEQLGLEVLDGMGSTEMTHIYCSSRSGQAQPGACGTAVGGYALRLVDEAGAEIEGAGVGEMWVRGESAATGYWCRAAESRGAFCGEWFRTGDLLARDADGAYRHLGRTDDMLKVRGEWVSPREVEAVVADHPGVSACTVVGVADRHGLTEVVACVVARTPGASREELEARWRERLTGYKRPSRVVFLPELPRTETGKVRRAALRASVSDAGVAQERST